MQVVGGELGIDRAIEVGLAGIVGGAGGKVTPAEFVDAVEVKEGVGASGSGRTRAATPPPSSASAGLIRAAGAGGSGAPLLSPPATGRATLDAEGGDGVV